MFCCCFPNCNFSTEYKSKIDKHHIIPKEVKKTKSTITLCKNHHALIYVPESTSGQHSIKTPESIQILEIYKSTKGKALHYQNYEGKKFFYFLESKENVEDI